jgi:hypothetical protein
MEALKEEKTINSYAGGISHVWQYAGISDRDLLC